MNPAKREEDYQSEEKKRGRGGAHSYVLFGYRKKLIESERVGESEINSFICQNTEP